MPEYKTPGVFVEEIPSFPPSISGVETSIPAFIGATQKADKITPGDLDLVPTIIDSVPEYEQYYGLAAPETGRRKRRRWKTPSVRRKEVSCFQGQTIAIAIGTAGLAAVQKFKLPTISYLLLRQKVTEFMTASSGV